MATYLDYARRDGDQPDRWPNLREAAAKPWMGQTALIGRRPWLVVGFDGEMYELENEFGAKMRSNKFEVLEYESENNRLVAATRVPDSPLDAGMKLADCDCGVGALDFDRDTYEWSVLTENGELVDVEKKIAELEDADWKVADTLKEAEMPPYDPIMDVQDHLYYCPQCGSPDTDTSADIAYCDNCGWHGSPDELLTEHDMTYDRVEQSPRHEPYHDDDWQYEGAVVEAVDDKYKGIDDPGHPKHMKGAPDKVSEIYNACMREDNGRGSTLDEKKESCAKIAWSTYKKEKKSELEQAPKVARIVMRDGKHCVVSEDGKKNLGCSDSLEGAKKRLREVEYFKHQGSLALADLEISKEAEQTGVEDRLDQDVAPLKCPNCGGHTIEQVNTKEETFHCLSCGKKFKHDVILNPSAPSEKKGGIGDYEHWNEEAPRVWYEEEGRHPQEYEPEDPEDYERNHGAEDAAWEEVGEYLEGLDDAELEEVARGGGAMAGVPYMEHLDPQGIIDSANNVLAERGQNTRMYRSKKATTFELVDSDGKPVTGGHYYNLHGDKYKIPDVIKVLEIKDGHIIATVDDNSTPLKISADDIQKEGYSFEPLPIYSNIEKHDLREAVGWAGDPDPLPTNRGPQNLGDLQKLPGNEFTLPTPSGGTLWVRTDSDGRVSGWSVPGWDGGPGKYSDRDLERVQSMVDAATVDAVKRDPSLSKVARRAFTPAEQKKLIEEKGNARNKDKLRLDDSHYVESNIEDDDINFLF